MGRCAWIVVVALWGCGAGRAPEPGPIAVPAGDLTPADGTKHARLARLGARAVERAPELATRVDPTTGIKTAALAKNRESLGEFRRLVTAEGQFQFASYDPFESTPPLEDFVALARLAEWAAEQAVAQDDWGGAIENSVALARLGAFLTGGDARAASTGLTFQDSAYHLLAKVQSLAPADRLAGLSESLVAVERANADPMVTLRNEAEQAKLTLENFRKLVRAEDWKSVERIVQPMAMGRLTAFRNQTPVEQDKTLRSLADDVTRHASLLAIAAFGPVVSRSEIPKRKKGPGEAFWPHAAQGMDAFIAQRDRVIAQGRILRVLVWSSSVAKTQGSVPRNLDKAPPDAVKDPYTGRKLLYLPAGREAKVYSPGPDLRDDGGSSSTDVVLEPGS